MVRKIFAVLAGLIAANLIIVLVQIASGFIYGVPDVRQGDAEAVARYIAGLPASAFLLLSVGYAIGYFAGGFVARKISQWDSLVLPVILGILGTIGWTLNVVAIPHPMWMVALGYFCFVPFAILGHMAAGAKVRGTFEPKHDSFPV